MLKDCRRRALDVVVVWKFDRKNITVGMSYTIRRPFGGLLIPLGLSGGGEWTRTTDLRIMRPECAPLDSIDSIPSSAESGKARQNPQPPRNQKDADIVKTSSRRDIGA